VLSLSTNKFKLVHSQAYTIKDLKTQKTNYAILSKADGNCIKRRYWRLEWVADVIGMVLMVTINIV